MSMELSGDGWGGKMSGNCSRVKTLEKCLHGGECPDPRAGLQVDMLGL